MCPDRSKSFNGNTRGKAASVHLRLLRVRYTLWLYMLSMYVHLCNVNGVLFSPFLAYIFLSRRLAIFAWLVSSSLGLKRFSSIFEYLLNSKCISFSHKFLLHNGVSDCVYVSISLVFANRFPLSLYFSLFMAEPCTGNLSNLNRARGMARTYT